VFENTREKKKWLNPERSQFRNDEFICRDRRFDQQRHGRMIATAGGNKRDRAGVVNATCVGMNALVQLWRGAEG